MKHLLIAIAITCAALHMTACRDEERPDGVHTIAELRQRQYRQDMAVKDAAWAAGIANITSAANPANASGQVGPVLVQPINNVK